MKKPFTLLFGAVLLCAVGTLMAGAANKYPPGPAYRSCPDSVTIYSVEQTDTTLAPCHPVTMGGAGLQDTVLGVRGVISGFDPRGPAYGFYIQNGTGPWTGVDIFTGATNYLSSVPGTPTGGNLLVGDSVVVYGVVQEFPATNGTTEIEGFDDTQSTNDIIIRKVNGGNFSPLRTHYTNIHELTWLTSQNTGAEQWEGCFVRLPGPLKVGRIAFTGIQSPNYLVTSVAASTDSVLIDAFTLTSVAPSAPVVGTLIDSIVGIVNQNTSNAASGSINSYRIQIRSGNDVYAATPPSLTDAYPLENNTLRLVFDKNLDQTTAEDKTKYSLASGIDGSTVDNAVLESNPGSVVILTITSVRSKGDIETVSANNIKSQGCGAPSCNMTPAQSRTFVNGVLKAADVQAPDPAYLPQFQDRSRFAGSGSLPGTKFTMRATCVHQYSSLYYIVDEDGGLRGGISVYAPVAPLVAGERYRIAGQCQEFFGETEEINSTFITDEGPGTIPNPAVEPVSVFRDTTTDMTQSVLTGEDFEGMLVKVSYVRVAEQRTLGQSFLVAGQKPSYPDTILISNLNGALDSYTPPDSAMTVDVTGMLHYANDFRICPRNAADIVVHGLNVGVDDNKLPTEVSLAVSPNPARTARVRFTLPNAERVDLGVFDLQGREIASLARGRLPAGEYTKEWNGVASGGQRAQPGMYFYRLKVGAKIHEARGVLLQ